MAGVGGALQRLKAATEAARRDAAARIGASAAATRALGPRVVVDSPVQVSIK
jgi:hypothetical protein